jgi:hypothetical protein
MNGHVERNDDHMNTTPATTTTPLDVYAAHRLLDDTIAEVLPRADPEAAAFLRDLARTARDTVPRDGVRLGDRIFDPSERAESHALLTTLGGTGLRPSAALPLEPRGFALILKSAGHVNRQAWLEHFGVYQGTTHQRHDEFGRVQGGERVVLVLTRKHSAPEIAALAARVIARAAAAGFTVNHVTERVLIASPGHRLAGTYADAQKGS